MSIEPAHTLKVRLNGGDTDDDPQWLRANGCPWDWRTRADAEERGHREVLQWAIDNGCPLRW